MTYHISPQSNADAKPPYYLGVDVGGTNLKLGLLDDAGQTIAYVAMPTQQERGGEESCQRIAQAAAQILEQAGIDLRDVARAGIAIPGPMDIPGGIVLRPGNLPGWWNFPIRDRISYHLNLPFTVSNDANAAAFGEFWRGTGEKFHSIVLLTLGTGVGGGIIIGDTLVKGAHGCGGECGHIIIDPSEEARHDSLGNRGTLEAYTNAAAVIDRANAALMAGIPSSLANRITAQQTITPRIVAEEGERGDQVARQVVLETARYLAFGIVTLVHAIDPDSVVLGGAMNFGGPTSQLGRDFLQQIRGEVRRRLLEPLRDKLRIEFATLGGDAGYIGAAGLARQEHHKRLASGVIPPPSKARHRSRGAVKVLRSSP